jgi:DNA-binding NtrC family response regulator
MKMPDLDGLDLLREVRELKPAPYIITTTAFGSIDIAIRAVKLGAYDYLTKPFSFDQLLLIIDRALSDLALRSEVARLREEVSRGDRLGDLIGHSDAMQKVFNLIRRVAVTTNNVLLTGESGTGKELVARALHSHSPRASKPFVAVNCTAIPDTLLEADLFGYKRGAFTDARADHAGLFVEAKGGTIFLDEIADLPLALQPKLLRVLQEREVRPLGSSRSELVDVRVIAATNLDIEARQREGAFRQDLYYRLNVVQIQIPPLRDRLEDVLPLAEHFLARAAAHAGGEPRSLGQATRKALLGHSWPGNVRELENVIGRAVALCDDQTIGPDALPPALHDQGKVQKLARSAASVQGMTLEDVERDYIQTVLAAEGGNKTRAAQRLGLDRKTLYRKLNPFPPANAKPEKDEK